jgi:predicted anti-sigma-YlaC factor YlaD
MDCERCREAISARIDGEPSGLTEAELGRHLAGCAACRRWEQAAVGATRAVRLRRAEAVPDLTAGIVRAIAAPPPRRAASAPTPAVIRVTLALVAVAQLFIAAPALVGRDLGATVHVAHEQGAWGLALAAALALAAWRPSRATALLPFLAVFVVSMGVLSLTDVLAGRVTPGAELPHLMAAVGLVLLWLEAHPPAGLAGGGTPTAPRRWVAA